MTQTTIHELLQLAEKAFQYYNGRINPNIPAVLEVVTIRDPNDARAAYTRYPNIVKLQPLNIYEWHRRNYEQFQIDRTRYTIIESVIHELYHVEQFLMYSNTAPDYILKIEADVDFMTASYVLSHLQEIYQVFGVVVDQEMIEYLRYFQPYKNKLYERKNVFEHICLFIDNTLGALDNRKTSNKIISKIIHYVEEVPDSVVKFIINNHVIIIKDKDYCIDIDRFNHEIYEYYCRFTHMKEFHASEKYSDTEYQYIIDTEGGCNMMARKIQK